MTSSRGCDGGGGGGGGDGRPARAAAPSPLPSATSRERSQRFPATAVSAAVECRPRTLKTSFIMEKLCLLAFLAIISTTAAEVNWTAVAYLSKGNVEGNLTFRQTDSGPVTITGTIKNLSDGKHGFHIHEMGDISECIKTGGHYNPHQEAHGAPNATVRHVGDLGNIESTGNVAVIQIEDSRISLHGEESILGRAVVVHEKEDDLGLTSHKDSKTTGNAGGRVVCGVIGIKDPVKWQMGASSSPSVSSLSMGIVSIIAAILSLF